MRQEALYCTTVSCPSSTQDPETGYAVQGDWRHGVNVIKQKGFMRIMRLLRNRRHPFQEYRRARHQLSCNSEERHRLLASLTVREVSFCGHSDVLAKVSRVPGQLADQRPTVSCSPPPSWPLEKSLTNALPIHRRRRSTSP